MVEISWKGFSIRFDCGPPPPMKYNESWKILPAGKGTILRNSRAVQEKAQEGSLSSASGIASQPETTVAGLWKSRPPFAAGTGYFSQPDRRQTT
ncbi:MAG: hypothetical protein P4L42_10805 [Desulfocapsaceae bacterium]|nr:hypothetical protein [Desulfocapsaceae bacterium]